MVQDKSEMIMSDYIIRFLLSCYDQLSLFDCLCFASSLSKGSKFDVEAKKTVFIRYSRNTKGL